MKKQFSEYATKEETYGSDSVTVVPEDDSDFMRYGYDAEFDDEQKEYLENQDKDESQIKQEQFEDKLDLYRREY
jgi:hypothetical protein